MKAKETKADNQCNKLMHLEDSMVMYGVYNAETLEKLISTVHQMHNITTLSERLFTGELNMAFMWYVNKQGVQHYAINSLLCLRTLQEKYVENVWGIHKASCICMQREKEF